MTKYKPVLIEWEDTTHYSIKDKDFTLEDIKKTNPIKEQTLGFLVSKNKRYVKIVIAKNEYGCIKKIRRLK